MKDKIKRRISITDFKFGQAERKAINDILDSGIISEDRNVREFQEVFRDFIGTKYAVAVSSGTAALMVGLRALYYYRGLKNRPKVITSPLTYIATINALVILGFEPVFIDVDRQQFSIRLDLIKEYLKKSKGIEKHSIILPVHLMGYPCDMDGINEVAKGYNLITVEDAAQAHGTKYKGRTVGSLSTLGIFSFGMAHNISAGELGAIVTDNKEIAGLCHRLKAHGRVCNCSICVRKDGLCPYLYRNHNFDPRFQHELIGFNFKTMEFPAALAVLQIKRADWIIKRRKFNVKYLIRKLSKHSSILQLPVYSENISYAAFPIVIKDSKIISREYLSRCLEENGIETRSLFGCIPLQQPAYVYLRKRYKDKLPNAEYIGRNGLYIGNHQYLEKEDLDFIADIFDKILRRL